MKKSYCILLGLLACLSPVFGQGDAVTNTPGLGAAQQAFSDMHGVSDNTIALGYAVAYPLGVIGIILSIILIKYIFLQYGIGRSDFDLLIAITPDTGNNKITMFQQVR